MKLRIEKPIYGGAGLAHLAEGEQAGKAVFVHFTLPSEFVEARLTEQKGDFEEASLVQVLTPSPDRVQPRCAHFGQCGGCHYQHATSSAQLQIKSEILLETLEHSGLTALPELQIHTAEPWAYRNRIRLRVAESDSTLRVGYNRRASNEFLAIHECPISAPLLLRAAEAFLRAAAEDANTMRLVRDVMEVEFFTTADEKNLQMTLFVRKEQNHLNAVCERMKKLLPELAGWEVSLLSPSGQQRHARSPRRLENGGSSGFNYFAAGQDYWVSRNSFFQVNRFLIDEFVRVVTAGRQGKVAWDLYAGVGLFSHALAKTFRQVVAVEADATDLSRFFKGPGRRAVESTTVQFLRGAVLQRERPELIVIDPPRAGAGQEVCALLAKIAPADIVYVSCDPVTLARDLRALIASGYKVSELHLVDMFPQTFHLETAVVLRR